MTDAGSAPGNTLKSGYPKNKFSKICGIGILILIAFFGSLTLLARLLAHVDVG